jgi:capsular polysaccharide biosynthesis protein
MHVNRLVIPSLSRETELTYPGDRYKGYVFSPVSYRYLRSKLRKAITDEPSDISISDRVYVSRSDAPVRRVINEERLLSELSASGFESYVLSEYAVADQIRLFDQADLIVGPMGAGLTNIAFSEDAGVVTLFGDDLNACYYTQSQGMGHRFAYVRGEPAGDDIRVDLSDVLNAIDRVED